MKTLNKWTLPILTITVLIVGCAKEKKYEEVFKDSVFSKSAISTDPNDPYVYVPSTGQTPMQVTASRSFWMGEQKLATFKFEEGELVALQLPDDERFAANSVNQSPILRVKIDHKDYRCTEDQFGECGNKEEENDKIDWRSKRFFKADFADLKIDETNTLPEQLTNAFVKCFGNEQTVVKDVKIEKDAINIHVQKTWQASIYCADIETFADLRNMAFTINYYYSFVKLSKLASKDYKPFNYPFEDQNTFGFFTTDVNRLSSDGRVNIDSKTTYMNRWNPDSKEIVYYLSEDFYQEDLKSIRLATEQGVQTINNSMERAGIDKRIVLKDGRGLNIGDLRNNFIVLVKDPQASGVIGYGPSIANPRTGEILKAQTIMYYGSMRRMIEQTYDDLIAEKKREEAIRQSEGADLNIALPAAGAPATAEAAERMDVNRNFMNSVLGTELSQRVQQRNNSRVSSTIASSSSLSTKKFSKEVFSSDRRVELSEWIQKLSDPNIDEETRAKAVMEEMSHQCFYHHSMVDWHSTLAPAINEGNLNVADLRPWIELSAEEQDKIIEQLMPMVWVPTFVHEVGHNLGLRHNFSGSEDKDNYYTAAERASLGIKRNVTYSSIMDYSGGQLNELSVLGKYDIAALKFGYKREIELKDGTAAVIPDGLTFEAMKRAPEGSRESQLVSQMKDFQFCTDEHVEVNPGCNRFDDGSGLKEIAQHYVDTYKKRIAKRNYRNNRARFSIVDDAGYYSGVRYTFEGLRRFFEIYDRFANGPYQGLLNMTDAQWDEQYNGASDELKPIVRSNQEFFAGVKTAVKIAADFYLEVLTTPDVHCAVVKKGGRTLEAIVPLSDLNADGQAVNCFDKENVGINPAYEIVGEVGRFFNHQRQKSLLPGELTAAADQLSVRGIWLDKLLAVRYLTARELGNSVFDDYRSNFLDYPEFGDKIRETLVGFLTDELQVTTELRLANGVTQPITDVFALGNTHLIKNVVNTRFHNRIGLNRVQKDIREIMLPIVKRSLVSADDVSGTLGFLNMLSVIEIGPTNILDPAQVGATAELRDASGLLIARYAATKDQKLALAMIQQRNARQQLEAFKREEVIAAYQALASNQVPTEIPENLKPLYSAPKEVLLAFLQGSLVSDDLMLRMFKVMAN